MTEEAFERVEWEKLATMPKAHGWERTVYKSKNTTPALYMLKDKKISAGKKAEKIHYQLTHVRKMHTREEILKLTVKVDY